MKAIQKPLPGFGGKSFAPIYNESIETSDTTLIRVQPGQMELNFEPNINDFKSAFKKYQEIFNAVSDEETINIIASESGRSVREVRELYNKMMSNLEI